MTSCRALGGKGRGVTASKAKGSDLWKVKGEEITASEVRRQALGGSREMRSLAVKKIPRVRSLVDLRRGTGRGKGKIKTANNIQANTFRHCKLSSLYDEP